MCNISDIEAEKFSHSFFEWWLKNLTKVKHSFRIKQNRPLFHEWVNFPYLKYFLNFAWLAYHFFNLKYTLDKWLSIFFCFTIRVVFFYPLRGSLISSWRSLLPFPLPWRLSYLLQEEARAPTRPGGGTCRRSRRQAGFSYCDVWTTKLQSTSRWI